MKERFVTLNKNPTVLKKGDIILFRSREQMLGQLWKSRKFDNYDMALMMIELLYEKGLVNDATYSSIMRKHNKTSRCSA